ncbi:type II toxin-antitoxin system PemK/MazF family toxin [Cellulomonas sp. URHE0023]|uniref:type II toxin-antitoxin system PemK/MazF family toxin n=1 Tax=Cellulomonas sp. URHE0023 TaxID=1380354 RepID=UPI000AD7B9FB|nr:type II toxin-antitoxin system PemK/MazF family toxin [Cellulomonas sp. URHE0023]
MTRATWWTALHRLLGRLTGRGAPHPTAAAPSVGRVVLPDHGGVVRPVYAPRPDGDADPGEIVWGWVPYEEDASQGKDRPVLVIARNGRAVLGLMLTSKDHTRNTASEARRGRVWMDIGSGPWDAKRRPSEIRLDRVVQLHPTAFRREGAVMDRALFDQVAVALRRCKGW